METTELRPPRGEEIPNHPTLPVLVYRGIDALGDGPAAAEGLITGNGWGGTWRDGVFAFHHFHSVSHEALAVVAGRARLAIGGPQGEAVDVAAGDALVLPGGTGHKRIDASADFLVVGAYPPDQEDYDVRRGDPAEREEVEGNIAAVALPPGDPFGGPLAEAWGL
ncbi:MAG TPA: cupin domain-containing protein [Solirubrobacteraceae bacterium]|jgi:uncharacterized protein YjlB